MRDDAVTTSWKRLSDTTRDDRQSSGGTQRAPPPRPNEQETQLQAWEDEGGTREIATGPVRILIVDNDIGSADSLEIMLHTSGYSQTRVAYSGQAALAMAAVFQPNVVLLDLSLLDMTGYELAHSLRAQAPGQQVRLIALTSGPEHAAREQAQLAGFERHLMKPVAPRNLSGLIEKPS
jgi:CheY-like chemotaxis protein